MADDAIPDPEEVATLRRLLAYHVRGITHVERRLTELEELTNDRQDMTTG